jgi:hypothetical protein
MKEEQKVLPPLKNQVKKRKFINPRGAPLIVHQSKIQLSKSPIRRSIEKEPFNKSAFGHTGGPS